MVSSIAACQRATGYAILVTNDPSYWAQPRNSHTADADFRLHGGRTLHGILDWGAGASEGTKRGREQPLYLSESYTLRWEDYSQPILGARYGKFRYLAIEAKSKSTM